MIGGRYPGGVSDSPCFSEQQRLVSLWKQYQMTMRAPARTHKTRGSRKVGFIITRKNNQLSWSRDMQCEKSLVLLTIDCYFLNVVAVVAEMLS